MIVTGNRQHLIRTDDLHHLEYVMLLYPECSRTRAGKRTTNLVSVSYAIKGNAIWILSN